MLIIDLIEDRIEEEEKWSESGARECAVYGRSITNSRPP